MTSPLLNALVLISVVAKPILEHLQKSDWKTDLLPPEIAMPLVLICSASIFAMVWTTVYFFMTAIRNINFFSGERQRSAYLAIFILVPIANLVVTPYLEYFAYHRSTAFALPHKTSKLRASFLVFSAFTLLVLSLAYGRLGEDNSQSTSYDALSLLVLSLSTGGAGGILTTRIFDRICNAQEIYAQQMGGAIDSGSVATGLHGDRKKNAIKSLSVAILIAITLATAVFPKMPSAVRQGIISHSQP